MKGRPAEDMAIDTPERANYGEGNGFLSISASETRNGASSRSEEQKSTLDDSSPPSMETASESDPSRPTGYCFIDTLPAELIASIFAYLTPVELALVAPTCRAVYAQATSDHLWQRLVQANVPGVPVVTPTPFASFRELYAAHDLRWFLPRYKLWFSGSRMTGKLVLVRFDPRRGVIEGYQLLAVSHRTTQQPWEADHDVTIHNFQPAVSLHLDRPELELRPVRPALADAWPEAAVRGRFAAETTMHLDGRPKGSLDSFCTFLLARPLPPDDDAAQPLDHLPAPGTLAVWPAPAVPAPHRVTAVGLGCKTLPLATARPRTRAEVSDRAFHVQKWRKPYLYTFMEREGLPRHDSGDVVEGPIAAADLVAVGLATQLHMAASDPPFTFLRFDPLRNGLAEPSRGRSGLLPPPGPDDILAAPAGFQPIFEEVETYATLDPALYTPTADKPWRGIWVGHYSAHGCEFLLIHQPDDADDDAPFDEAALVRTPGEDAEAFARRVHDARVYRGRLEAVKLTGDPNVPRGEPTFVVDDLGDKGFVAVVREAPFAGVRAVKSRGHVARPGFRDDIYIESHLLLISHDRLAQYWVGFAHISYFERVDIDRLLVP